LLTRGDTYGMNLSAFMKYQTFWTALLFVCLAIITLGANPFLGETVAPMDLLLILPGWSSTQAVDHTVNWQPSDIVNGQLPVWINLKGQVRAGTFPLWYPPGAGGEPVVLEFMNPLFWVFTAVRDHAFAYYLVCLLKLAVAGFGGYLLVRIFTGWLPAVWGGMAYMLCGFNTAWFFWDHIATSMWIPWLLWAGVLYLTTEDRKRLPAISLLTFLLLAGGFPAVAAFGLYAFGLLVLIWNAHTSLVVQGRITVSSAALKHFVRGTAWPLVAAGLAFVMAGVLFIPFVSFMSGINLSSRIGMTHFNNGVRDLMLFLYHERPLTVERTAYVGAAVVLLACVGVYASFRQQSGPARKFILFNAVLVILSVLITFGLLPHGMIRSMPVFASNAWNRMIVIPQMGLAVLSGFGIELLLVGLTTLLEKIRPASRAVARRTVMAIFLAALALQWHAYAGFFREYNAVVPSSWFYPVTPSIRYVKERLEPLQSVIADDSYGVSGALGAYGIPEWYAHSFRPDREKEVLAELVHEPFTSNTVAFILGEQIQFESSLMDKLGIKYVLLNKYGAGNKLLYAMQETQPALAPPLPENTWQQHFILPNDAVFSAFGFLFHTYGGKNAPADVRLTIARGDGVLCQLEPVVGRESVRDNEWVFFGFAPRLPLTKGEYVLSLSLDGRSGNGRLSARTTRGYERTGNFLAVNGVDTGTSLYMKIVLQEPTDTSRFSGKWRLLELEKDIYLLENKNVSGSAYFVPTLDASNKRLDYSGIRVASRSPVHLRIENAREEQGWIVLPMHLDRGWKARVDGRIAAYDAYLGILPAIPVRGAGTIVLTYEPSPFRYGLVLSMAGIVLFIYFTRFCLKPGRQA